MIVRSSFPSFVVHSVDSFLTDPSEVVVGVNKCSPIRYCRQLSKKSLVLGSVRKVPYLLCRDICRPPLSGTSHEVEKHIWRKWSERGVTKSVAALTTLSMTYVRARRS